MSITGEKCICLLLSKGKKEQISETSRVAALFAEFRKQGISAELIMYSDEKVTEVENQIYQLDLVIVWVNPIREGRDRRILNPMDFLLYKEFKY